jgi:hypothetical protein
VVEEELDSKCIVNCCPKNNFNIRDIDSKHMYSIYSL